MSAFWDDSPENGEPRARSDVVDLRYRIRGSTLPVDHAHALAEAITAVLPWLGEDPGSGVVPIHGAASGNGWTRPDPRLGDVLHLPRRTRLAIRLPRSRSEAALALCGRTLLVCGASLAVGDADIRPLTPAPALFARHVATAPGESESNLVERAAAALEALGVPARKIVCGRAHHLTMPGERIATRSMLVASVPPAASLRLQELGIGELRRVGCGIFAPHKSVDAVRESADEP